MSYRHAYKNDFRLLQWVSVMMIGGIVVFAVLIHFYNGNRVAFMHDHPSEKYFFPALIILCLAGLYVARFIYSRRMGYIHIDSVTVASRMNQYKTTHFLHNAICEIPAILSIVCFMLFGNYIYLFFVALVLAELISKFPTNNRINDSISLLKF